MLIPPLDRINRWILVQELRKEPAAWMLFMVTLTATVFGIYEILR